MSESSVTAFPTQHGFDVADNAIRDGLARVWWPGRIQLLQREPTVVVDAAHNTDSVQRLLETVRRHFDYRRLILVFGASGDKDVAGMVQLLGPAADRVIATNSGHRRAANTEALAARFVGYAEAEAEPDPTAAIRKALDAAGPEDLVLVAGSVFLAGRALEALGKGYE